MSDPVDLSGAAARTELAALLQWTSELESALLTAAAGTDEPRLDRQSRPSGAAERLRRAIIRHAAERMNDSAVRPLRAALADLSADENGSGARVRANASEAGSPAAGGGSGLDGAGLQVGEQLWQVAKDATMLGLSLSLPNGLPEAIAALQDLALRFASEQGEDVATARLAELKEIMAGLPREIRSQTDGPYLVTHVENMTDWLGERLPARPQMALCRCGASKMKPFCDGSHAEIGFTTEKDAKRVPDRLDTYVGQQVTILDNRGTCQHSGLCTDRLQTVFRLDEEPFVAPSGGRMDEIIRAVRDCPSGALSYAIDGREARDQVDYHGEREPTIEVSKDGPYRVTGVIALTDGKGEDEQRNDGASREHYALCRCGKSQNKPFCSGMHWYVDFKDPVPDPDLEPSMFEWAGGLPGLTRLTRLFYEKHVPEDPLLAPLFANMSVDHPQRVAMWLGEVFGGPASYSEQCGEYAGGYSRMIAQHIGKGLSEEKRARWVSLLLRSASEAGLPNDPEFRAAFQSYIEWGSRLAVENSQPGAKPPERMPMPHWDWRTAAGPPGSRVSVLEPASEEDQPVVLPHADEPVSFEKHVKSLFRNRDRQSMKFAFDLWAFDDVKQNAHAILERLRDGSMPCDGAWPKAKFETFDRWVTTGMRQ